MSVRSVSSDWDTTSGGVSVAHAVDRSLLPGEAHTSSDLRLLGFRGDPSRHFYEDILDVPLVATVVIEDRLGDEGSGNCCTFFADRRRQFSHFL
jgi:hypothetical protein